MIDNFRDRYLRRSPRARPLDFGIAMVIGGAFLSYSDSSLSVLKLSSYVLGLAGLGLLTAISSPFSRGQFYFAGLFCLGILETTVLSVLLGNADAGMARLAQELLYPVVLFLSSIVLFRIQSASAGPLLAMIAGLGIANFGAAVLGSFGLVRSLPLVGSMEIGRDIFGTQIASASGLTFNVNYYSVSQASFFWFYGIVAHARGRFGLRDRFFLGVLFASSVWGSSRGALLSLVLAAVFMVLLIALLDRGRDARIAWASLGILTVSTGASMLLLSDELYQIFRLAKGLNMRDTIWSRGLDLWLQRPILGWGLDVDFAQRFATGALPEGKSFHSGFLMTLVRGGAVLFVFSYGLLVAGLTWGLGARRDLWLSHRWAVGAVVFYLVNAAFRTFSLGGIGLLPILACTGLSICLHARTTTELPGGVGGS